MNVTRDTLNRIAWKIVDREHYCEEQGCDIAEAQANGYSLIALSLLDSAIGLYKPATVRVLREAGPLFDMPEWPAWVEHFKAHGVHCDACNGYTFDEQDGDHCASCFAELSV